LSTPRRIELLLVLAAALAGCGEAESSKSIGAQPKQMVDRASTDVNKALQQGAERSREAEEKK